MESRERQLQFLAAVESHFKTKNEMIDFLKERLSLGKSAIYKKLRGDTMLNLDELMILSESFNISLDEYFGNQEAFVPFSFPAIQSKDQRQKFFHELLTDLESLSAKKNSKVYYTTRELPIFYYFIDKNLTLFKMYFFSLSAWDPKNTPPFSLDTAHFFREEIETCEKMLHEYQQIPSTEIWNTYILDNTFQQIQYVLESGLFKDPGEALTLYEAMGDLLAALKKMVKQKRKSDYSGKQGAEFNLYNNDIVHVNNTVIAISDQIKEVYTTFDNPNYLKCSHREFCDYAIDWFERLKNKSRPVSEGSERDQLGFFHVLEKRLSDNQAQAAIKVEQLA